MSKHILNQIHEILVQRKDADPKKSYVAKLYKRGTPKIAQKIGEEAAEAIIEAIRVEEKPKSKKRRNDLKEELADLLFHISVLQAHLGITPDEIFEILGSRFGVSGLDEKASREKDRE